ncbi:MAG: hypothetical protein H7Y86_12475 [Rhizobacter sp.]|nr:hypothetical protein [Ferruginibacter sp.]
MNLRSALLSEHSKEQCKAIVDWVGNSKKRFDELFSLFLNDEHRVIQRAAFPVSYCLEAYPSLIDKHFENLVKKLQQPGIHDAVKRNTTRLLQNVIIPQEWQGAIMNICFEYVAFQKEAVAIKAFSMSVLANLAKDYPEILPELKLIIEDQWKRHTPAFKGRAGKLFKNLNSL